MPGAITVSSPPSMAEWARRLDNGEKVRYAFRTLPGRLEFEQPGRPDSVARFMVEVPEEVGQQQALRQMEFMVRALKVDFVPTRIDSATFVYEPPPSPYVEKRTVAANGTSQVSVSVESGALARYNRSVRDYGLEARPYRSLIYVVKGAEVEPLRQRVIDEAEDLRYLERTFDDGDTSGVYYKGDSPMAGFLFNSSHVRAGKGDFTTESYSFMAAADENEDLNFELEEDWLTVGDFGVARN